MGHVAPSKTVPEELANQQHVSIEPAAISTPIVPTTPDNTPQPAMTDANSPQISEAQQPEVTSFEHSEPAAPPAKADNDSEPQSTERNAGRGAEGNEDPYASLDSDTELAIDITNPSDFPVIRIQEVEAHYQPSTKITNMLCHKTPSGPITRVTADVKDGSVDHLIIDDPHIINALGLTAPAFDTIYSDPADYTALLRLRETFVLNVLPGHRPEDPKEYIVAELVSARHPYLYWLDERKSADPTIPPYAAEAKAIARKTRRRWSDVWLEIEEVWDYEQGENGKWYRENRQMYLGEDPTYPEGAVWVPRSMFV
ncbi:hypothetical protein B5807_01238 [Epicoccum nigrum]|uniref:Uncharacterized protein n=1 Tax=Epicoccum nigrum TaxID=105696 RepID=A0A1Y2MBZ2_EPING|nr:hypothetical protein B5807_01238 [Epicoccum nigrum]